MAKDKSIQPNMLCQVAYPDSTGDMLNVGICVRTRELYRGGPVNIGNGMYIGMEDDLPGPLWIVDAVTQSGIQARNREISTMLMNFPVGIFQERQLEPLPGEDDVAKFDAQQELDAPVNKQETENPKEQREVEKEKAKA
jgi:hypothetical protein